MARRQPLEPGGRQELERQHSTETCSKSRRTGARSQDINRKEKEKESSREIEAPKASCRKKCGKEEKERGSANIKARAMDTVDRCTHIASDTTTLLFWCSATAGSYTQVHGRRPLLHLLWSWSYHTTTAHDPNALPRLNLERNNPP